jgi:hypothetical protein
MFNESFKITDKSIGYTHYVYYKIYIKENNHKLYSVTGMLMDVIMSMFEDNYIDSIEYIMEEYNFT